MKKLWASASCTTMAALAAGGALAQGSIIGDWDGELTVPAGMKVPLILHLTDHGATLDSPDQHATGVPIVVTRGAGSVQVEIPSSKARFMGVLAPDGKSMSGPFAQGGMTMQARFSLRAAGAAAPGRERPQTPRPPFPYVARDVTFTGGGGVPLAGTVTMPAGPGPFPAVVMIAGSGPQNRDETVDGHKIFWVIADRLTRKGIAVLRYDKRGVERSKGDYAHATPADFAEDAGAAFAWLRSQTGIAPDRVGLIGHSEGAEIAPRVAERDARVHFVVLLCAPALPGEEIIVSQQRAIALARGTAAAKAEADSRLERQLLDTVLHTPDAAQAQASVASALVAHGMSAERAAADAKAMTSPWYRAFLDDDPAPALRALRAPTLVVAGSLDLQVLPAANLPVIRMALAGDPDARIVELPGLNHLLQPATTGTPQEYGSIPITIAPAALDLISDWVSDHVR